MPAVFLAASVFKASAGHRTARGREVIPSGDREQDARLGAWQPEANNLARPQAYGRNLDAQALFGINFSNGTSPAVCESTRIDYISHLTWFNEFRIIIDGLEVTTGSNVELLPKVYGPVLLQACGNN